jgi:hypothetical protein
MAEMLEAKLGPSVEPGRVKTATTKSGDVKAAMTEAAPEAPKAPVEATKAAMATTTTAATEEATRPIESAHSPSQKTS